jgi:hypothetical protein
LFVKPSTCSAFTGRPPARHACPTQHLKKGNVEIRKTIAVNRSTQKYIVALLLAATLGLLFLDW